MNKRRYFAARASTYFGAVLFLSTLHTAQAAPANCPALLQRDMPRLQDEKPQALCQYAGKVLLVVNTASFCGFTSQYKSLETLSARYADRGLVVLGFPSNDFGSQEPGSNKEIAEFCENTFNVKFPMFSKSVVKPGRPDTNPLFADLAQRTGSSPKWNFHKYLISRDGRQVQSFGSMTDPLSRSITEEVERQLAKP
ncbi:glutathione peroxidase [Paucibacter sp. AS339]|uniref:glutathione peroxidase n=1 Tax=Paucibacter hankyongi TaxID=3133434 RepID=UPI00309FB64D